MAPFDSRASNISRQLFSQVHPNRTIERDARKSGARPSL